MSILGFTFDLFAPPAETLVNLSDYYGDLLCGERLQVYNPLTGRWQRGVIKDVSDDVYLGERDVYRAYWVANDGGFSEWLLVDEVLEALGLEG